MTSRPITPSEIIEACAVITPPLLVGGLLASPGNLGTVGKTLMGGFGEGLLAVDVRHTPLTQSMLLMSKLAIGCKGDLPLSSWYALRGAADVITRLSASDGASSADLAEAFGAGRELVFAANRALVSRGCWSIVD